VRVIQLHIHSRSRKKSLRYGMDGWFKNQSGSDKFSEPSLLARGSKRGIDRGKNIRFILHHDHCALQ
jgi:hypothetical protein